MHLALQPQKRATEPPWGPEPAGGAAFPGGTAGCPFKAAVPEMTDGSKILGLRFWVKSICVSLQGLGIRVPQFGQAAWHVDQESRLLRLGESLIPQRSYPHSRQCQWLPGITNCCSRIIDRVIPTFLLQARNHGIFGLRFGVRSGSSPRPLAPFKTRRTMASLV